MKRAIIIEFRELQYVLMVAKERSFSIAAQKLFITQPSLSQCISRIEENLGVRLFDRTKKPLKLTFAGEQFLETARNILILEQQLIKQMNDISQLKKERITLGISQYRGRYFLPKVLPAFIKKYPGIDISIREESPIHLETLVLNGDIDFAVLLLPVRSLEIAYQIIHKEQPLIAVSPDHALNTNPNVNRNTKPHATINIHELRNETLILLDTSRAQMMLNEYFKQNNFIPKSVLKIKNLETAHAFAAAGIGVAFISDVLIPYCAPKFRAQYYLLEDHLPEQLQLAFAYRKNAYLSKTILAFFEVTKQIFK